jgi:adenylylsulfate kinase-like enzyme
MIFWLIGLSGAGKSTVGRALTDAIRNDSDQPVVYLDGDELRDVWGDSLGHTLEARNQNAHRISHLCRLLDKNGVTVVGTVLSIFPEWLEWNRSKFSAYFEVLLDVPMEVLEARDTKGLYAAFAKGDTQNVVGKDIRFPRPANPDMVIDFSREQPQPMDLALKILKAARATPSERGSPGTAND